MNRTEFIIAMTIVLFIAFGLGWFSSWLVHRLTRVTQAEISDLDQMARDLHEAEETRDQALAYIEQREGELTNRLGQTEAELRAAMTACATYVPKPKNCAPRLNGPATAKRFRGLPPAPPVWRRLRNSCRKRNCLPPFPAG